MKKTCAAFAVACFVFSLFASDWYVATNGSDDNAGSQDAPFATLAKALAEAQDDDVIHVADGTYQPTAPVLVDKAVEIVGNDADRSQVTFDGQQKYKLASVSNAGAVIHGMTFWRGQGDSSSILSAPGGSYFHGCSLEMTAGILSNCVIRSGKASYSGCLSVWGTAKVFDCVIADGTNTDGNGDAAGLGGCVKLNGDAIVSSCTIYGGKAVNGGNAYVASSSATLADCVVSNNASGVSNGGGIYVKGGGVVSNCVVMANSATGKGGGVYVDNGKVFNTLVTGNSAQYGGGVSLGGSSARLINCTVAGNAATGLGGNLYRTAAAQMFNTIVAGGIYSTAGTDTTCCIEDIPGFRNAAAGDYRLVAASSCVDAGTDQNWGDGAADLSGATPRVIDGDGDGVATVDIGAYEYDPATAPVACSFRYDAPSVAAFPMSVTFTPAVGGACGEVTSVAWDFGDETADSSSALAATSHSYAAAGAYTVTLTVGTTLGGTLTATRTVVLRGATAYVSTSGSATIPYATPATAARSLADALSAVGTPASGKARIVVADGTYQPSAPVLLMTDIEIVGNDADPSQVIFDGHGKYKLMSIGSAGAFVHGVTFANGKGNSASNLSSPPSWFQGCSVEMNAGTISNCVIHSGKANYSGCVSAWGTARILDSVIANGENADSNPDNAARGGSLKIGGNAEARRCTIIGGKAIMGAGATVEGHALVSDCTFSGGTVTGNNGTNGGGGIHIRDNGVVSNCVVTACTNTVANPGTGFGGGGIHLLGGTVVNTLVFGNRGNVGGGICQNGGKVVNCTVAGNTATISASGVRQTAGQIVNSIIAGNAMNDGKAFATSGGTAAYSCALGLDTASGNIGVDPMGYFRDPRNNDYSLLGSFPGIDTGDPSVAFPADATDISGSTRRVLDGTGDGTAVVDMGAYEYDYAAMPVSASLAYSIVEYAAFAPTVVLFTPALEGPYGEITSVSWNFGDGQTEAAQTVDVIRHSYAAAGTYTATLTIETTSGGTVSSSVAFAIAPLVVHVSREGTAEAPYDTAARATPSLSDAFGALGTALTGSACVIVADGTYDAPASRIGITKDVEIRGNDADPSRVVIDGANSRAFFFVNSPGALLHGVTFFRGNYTGGQTTGSPVGYSQAALEIASGTVSNCVIDSCKCAYAGGASLWGYGRLIDCLVANCANRDGNGGIAAKGGGVKMYQNAYVSGCVITNNSAVRGAGLYMFGGLAENCVLFANKAGDYGGGLGLEGGTARNILAYGNATKFGGGAYLCDGKAILESATVADNASQSGTGRDIYMTAGTVRNAIVADALSDYDAEDPPLVTTGGTVAYCCSPSLTAGTDGNIAAAPVFTDPASRDYRPKGRSPTINVGDNQDWMADGCDFDGKPRIENKFVDMGCYETLVHRATTIILK